MLWYLRTSPGKRIKWKRKGIKVHQTPTTRPRERGEGKGRAPLKRGRYTEVRGTISGNDKIVPTGARTNRRQERGRRHAGSQLNGIKGGLNWGPGVEETFSLRSHPSKRGETNSFLAGGEGQRWGLDFRQQGARKEGGVQDRKGGTYLCLDLTKKGRLHRGKIQASW